MTSLSAELNRRFCTGSATAEMVNGGRSKAKRELTSGSGKTGEVKFSPAVKDTSGGDLTNKSPCWGLDNGSDKNCKEDRRGRQFLSLHEADVRNDDGRRRRSASTSTTDLGRLVLNRTERFSGGGSQRTHRMVLEAVTSSLAFRDITHHLASTYIDSRLENFSRRFRGGAAVAAAVDEDDDDDDLEGDHFAVFGEAPARPDSTEGCEDVGRGPHTCGSVLPPPAKVKVKVKRGPCKIRWIGGKGGGLAPNRRPSGHGCPPMEPAGLGGPITPGRRSKGAFIRNGVRKVSQLVTTALRKTGRRSKGSRSKLDSRAAAAAVKRSSDEDNSSPSGRGMWLNAAKGLLISNCRQHVMDLKQSKSLSKVHIMNTYQDCCIRER